MYVCLFVCLYVCMYVLMYDIYVCMYVCVYVCYNRKPVYNKMFCVMYMDILKQIDKKTGLCNINMFDVMMSMTVNWTSEYFRII